MKISIPSMAICCPIELFFIILTITGLYFISMKEETETTNKFSHLKTRHANTFIIFLKGRRTFNG